MTFFLAFLVIPAAAFIKGVIGFGFPAIATPALALVMDVTMAVPALILPNIMMDGIQALRLSGLAATLRRHALLYACGLVGMFVGTRLLVILPPRIITLILGSFVLAFVGLNLSRLSFTVAPTLERTLSPWIGLVSGVVGGITNVPGQPLVPYLYALGMDKAEFVRSVAVSLFIYKVIQLAAVLQVGLMTWPLFRLSLLNSALALGGFWLGVKVQDRVDAAAFNRLILGFLALVGVGLIARSL